MQETTFPAVREITKIHSINALDIGNTLYSISAGT